MFTRKRIAIFYCGGLSSTVKNQTSLLKELQPYDEMDLIADISLHYVSLPQGTGTKYTQLQQLALNIQKKWNSFDGAVVLFNYDTLTYEAGLLAFMLGQPGKPIVCTSVEPPVTPSSFSPLHHSESRAKFMNAVQGATGELGGCMLIVGSALFPATHVAIKEGRKLQFVSADNMIYGIITFGVQVTPYAPARTELPPEVRFEYAENVQWLHSIEQQQYFTVPTILDHIQSLTATELERLVVAPTLLLQNESILLFENNNIEEVKHMTLYAAAAKFVWCLGQMSRLDLSAIERRRSLAEWMRLPMMDEFLLSAD